MKAMLSAFSGLAVLVGGLALAPSAAEAQNRGPQGQARGSYVRSCEGIRVSQGILTAQCRDERGELRRSTLNIERCGNYDIANSNGLLVCGNNRGTFERNDRYDRDDRRDDRYGRSSITVYRDANYRGQQMTFTGAVSNLRTQGMNDAISSIRIPRNSGDWMVCADADFRGRCEVISSDISDLNRLRMNDTISSLRPVERRNPGRGDYRPR
ncbi:MULTISPECIES: beta/gamma crystallin-related protein [unclassified Brevundimonas]|uniref:beta/gamma crystallin-related protein n=1 Tax=unclassified Brevundimonas TaxID=2622653 RepID=UPI0025C50DBF|nr:MULTISPECIES: beta/gamma crystallin-related protein [unclassified Brevundimonas]